METAGPAAPERAGRWSRIGWLLPAVAVARTYERGWLRGDLLAGLTLWALLIPQGLAYGQLAGLAPVTGLYVGLVAMLAYALLGTSRYVTVGPESSVAMIVAVELAPLADGDPARYVALAGLLALLVGAGLLLGFVARLGIVTRLLSGPVLTGYLAGSGIVIALSQLPKATGISTHRSYPGVLDGLVRNAETAEPWAVAVAIGTAAIALGLARVARRLPAALIALAVATVVVALTGLSDTVAVVGHVQAGLPTPALPAAGFDDVGSLLAPAGSIALLVFASTVLTGEALAARDRENVRPNREFLALGVANLGAGFVHGFPANGSDSRSFAAAAAGARTQLAGVAGAALVVVTLLFLTPLFHDLPAAALGAVVIVTALRLVDVRELRRLWRVRSSDFVLAIVTLAAVLTLGVLLGIVVGVIASLAEALRRAALPHTAVLGQLAGETPAYRDVEEHEGVRTIPGLIVYRFDAPLFFANVDVFRNDLLRLVDDASDPVRLVIVNAEAIYDVDTTGMRMLERLHDELATRSIALSFARVKSKPLRLMRASGLEERVGSQNIWLRVEDAVAAFRAGEPAPTRKP